MLSLVYAGAIVRVYVRQPATLPEVAGSLTSSVGAYRIDQARFEAGLAFFRKDQFVEARDAFAQADPARQDAAVQFYIAYAYLRQGWGRVYADDALYKAGQATLAHARSLAPMRHHRRRRPEPAAAYGRGTRRRVPARPDARALGPEPGPGLQGAAVSRPTGGPEGPRYMTAGQAHDADCCVASRATCP